MCGDGRAGNHAFAPCPNCPRAWPSDQEERYARVGSARGGASQAGSTFTRGPTAPFSAKIGFGHGKYEALRAAGGGRVAGGAPGTSRKLGLGGCPCARAGARPVRLRLTCMVARWGRHYFLITVGVCGIGTSRPGSKPVAGRGGAREGRGPGLRLGLGMPQRLRPT